MKVLEYKDKVLAASPRFAALARFLLVGFSGILVNEIVYVGLTDRARVWFVASAVVATAASTTWNFLGNEWWSFRGRRFVGPAWLRFGAYAGMNVALLWLRVPMLWVLSDVGRFGSASSNLISLGFFFVLRFAVSDGWVWRKKEAGAPSEAGGSAAGVPKFRYDIGGLLRLDSDSELPELAYFLTEATTPPDIRIRVRRVGAFPTTRVRLKRDGDRVTYREHLGIFGADFNVTMGNPIEIDASPLLGLSRHVLYTNVVEALLRFVLVSKGYVLLHSAGLEVEGEATLLSAQTDTGKTSTVINLVRERHWRFISDDMAIIDPKGFVRTFPKPMTLSYHTMTRAVDASTLSPKKRMQLQVQSRVHSKSGRTVGKGLGSLNVPIMSINSVLQIMVPPPKYHITKLLPARIAVETPIANVFLMERGEPVQELVKLDAAIDQLIENTDDAYGFPPFATLAPNLMIGGEDYQQLRAHERRLLTEALKNVTVWRLRVRGHEWNELLPRLILGNEAAMPVGIPVETEDREPVGIPIEVEAPAPAVAAASSPSEKIPGGLFGSSSPRAHGEVLAAGLSYATSVADEVQNDAPRGPRGHAGAVATVGGGAAPPAGVSDAIAIQPAGSFSLPIGLPLAPDFSGILARVVSRIRDNARVWLAIGAILVVGAAVRLWAIGAIGLNNDEAVYAGQGASLAGDQTYLGLFAIFRAHPLLVQFLNSIPFRFVGVNDLTPRLISVAFGLAGVGLAYATGSLLYNRRVGLIAAAVLALMPYHVVVTRQALLDGPETTLFLLSIYQMAQFARSRQPLWLYGTAFATGLTVLAKETAVLLVPVAVIFLLLTPEIRIAFRRQLVSIALFLMAVAPYPIAIVIGKGTNAAQSFVLWEVLRQPNHTWTFYADILPGAVGPIVLFAGIAGLVYVLRRGLWEDRLLITWIAVPVAFFEIWPVKGYQYLLPIAPAIAILAGLSFDHLLTVAARRAATVPVRIAARTAGKISAKTAAKMPSGTSGRATRKPAGAVIAAKAQPLPSRFEILRDRAREAALPLRGRARAAVLPVVGRVREAVQPRAGRAREAIKPLANSARQRVLTLASRTTEVAQPIADRLAGHLPGRVTGFIRQSRPTAVVASSALLAVMLISIAVPTAGAVSSTSMSGSLAGTGGLPGGRDTGLWIKANVPQGAAFLTEGPTMANIIEFYGQRRAYGLSVSPNPIRRNPAYDPIVNPDRALQLNKIQYIATDIWSAQRSPFFDGTLRGYVHRYHGTLVYQQTAQTRDTSGKLSNRVVIQIYEVRP